MWRDLVQFERWRGANLCFKSAVNLAIASFAGKTVTIVAMHCFSYKEGRALGQNKVAAGDNPQAGATV